MTTGKKITMSTVIVLVAAAIIILLAIRNPKGVVAPTDVLPGDTNSETGNTGTSGGTIIPPQNVSPSAEAAYNTAMEEARTYKSAGDAGNKQSYYSAIASYRTAAEVTKNTVWLPYLNMGNVYKLLGDYQGALAAYDTALGIASDSAIYLAKIELVQEYMKRPYAEVVQLYDQALAKTVENVNIYINYASYLKANGKYAAALEIYKTLSASYPENQNFKNLVVEMQAKVDAQ